MEQLFTPTSIQPISEKEIDSIEPMSEAEESYITDRMTEYASERDMYHIPAYDTLPEDEENEEDDDECPDDDGRFDAWA